MRFVLLALISLLVLTSFAAEAAEGDDVMSLTPFYAEPDVTQGTEMRRRHHHSHSRTKRAPKRPKKSKRPKPLPSVPAWADLADGTVDGAYTPAGDGNGTTVYVVDSGCVGDTSVSFVPGDDASFHDSLGHGTLVVSIIRYLVPRARIVCMKVFDADGTTPFDRLVTAFNATVADCEDPRKCVVNFSGQGGFSSKLNFAVAAMVRAGVRLVTVSGNVPISDSPTFVPSFFEMNACNWAPAGYFGVTAVGATDLSRVVPYWSRIGPCVSTFAPGSGLAVNGMIIYGTSFACAFETARVSECASLGDYECEGLVGTSIAGFDPRTVQHYAALINKTTRRFVEL